MAEAGCSAAACTIGRRAARPLLQSAQSAAQRASSTRDPQEHRHGDGGLWRSRRFDRAGARVAGSEDVAARIHVDAHDLRVPVGLGVVLDPRSLARRRARLDDEAIVDARVLRASARRVELVVGVGQLAYVGSKMARASAGAPEASPSARSCPTHAVPQAPRPVRPISQRGRLWLAHRASVLLSTCRRWPGSTFELRMVATVSSVSLALISP